MAKLREDLEQQKQDLKRANDEKEDLMNKITENEGGMNTALQQLKSQNVS